MVFLSINRGFPFEFNLHIRNKWGLAFTGPNHSFIAHNIVNSHNYMSSFLTVLGSRAFWEDSGHRITLSVIGAFVGRLLTSGKVERYPDCGLCVLV